MPQLRRTDLERRPRLPLLWERRGDGLAPRRGLLRRRAARGRLLLERGGSAVALRHRSLAGRAPPLRERRLLRLDDDLRVLLVGPRPDRVPRARVALARARHAPTSGVGARQLTSSRSSERPLPS